MPSEVIRHSTKIQDVFVADLETAVDSRGQFTELFRQNWFDIKTPIQWNAVSSYAGTFRGFHVHKKHADYLTVLQGQVHFLLKDLRQSSSTFEVEQEIVITADKVQGLYLPPGVAHAFYFPVAAIHVYAVTEYWDLADELGFNYQDPCHAFQLDVLDLNVSERDRQLGSYQELLAQISSCTFI